MGSLMFTEIVVVTCLSSARMHDSRTDVVESPFLVVAYEVDIVRAWDLLIANFLQSAKLCSKAPLSLLVSFNPVQM